MWALGLTVPQSILLRADEFFLDHGTSPGAKNEVSSTPKWRLKRMNCRRSEIQQIEAPASATRDSDGSSGRHRDLEPVRLLKAMSIARSKAGCARFLTLIHSRHRPER